MTQTDPFAAVARRLWPDARLVGSRRLHGGVSADVHALELTDGAGRPRTVVLRQHRSAEWKPEQGLGPVTEHALLEALHGAGLPVPEPLLLDVSGTLLERPYLVMSFVDGAVDVAAEHLPRCLDVMAGTLLRIHALPAGQLPTLPPRLDPLPELFDYLPPGPTSDRLRSHLEHWSDSAYRGEPALLHGDFWPGNLLWRDGELTGILDWEDAALGDPLSDVASCRLELTLKHDTAAADRFADAYAGQRTIEARRLHLWELYVAAAITRFMGDWGLEPALEARMRPRAEAFLQRAAEAVLALPARPADRP